MTLLVIAVVLLWLLVGCGLWFGYQLVLQNGRILVRLEMLEQRVTQGTDEAAAEPQGLPLGAAAPAFELPGLTDSRMTLEQFRGRRVLLIFFNPSCGFCQQMAPSLATNPRVGRDGRPIPVVVAIGDVEANRALVKKNGIGCPVLIDQDMAVYAAYQADGTPTGYLIDEQGRIASSHALGEQALLTLIDTPPALPAEPEGDKAPPHTNGHKTHQGNRSLTDSRIRRDGLSAGTPAPSFRLPRLDRGELSLETYRGHRVLLIFSDPNCGPCDELAPQLEQVHRHTPDVQVLMISRGDREANQMKVAKHKLTFPIGLQRQWEISRAYGMFATPIGYLIDEAGIITTEVAVGAEAILALLSEAPVRTNRTESATVGGG